MCTVNSSRHLPQVNESAPDFGALRNQADAACRLLKVLSNPDRLLLLCQLSQAELRVGQLEEMVGVSQPTLSQQLAVLREEGLVSTRRDGKHIYYQIASAQALAVMNVLFEQFCGAAHERRPSGADVDSGQ